MEFPVHQNPIDICLTDRTYRQKQATETIGAVDLLIFIVESGTIDQLFTFTAFEMLQMPCSCPFHDARL